MKLRSRATLMNYLSLRFTPLQAMTHPFPSSGSLKEGSAKMGQVSLATIDLNLHNDFSSLPWPEV